MRIIYLKLIFFVIVIIILLCFLIQKEIFHFGQYRTLENCTVLYRKR